MVASNPSHQGSEALAFVELPTWPHLLFLTSTAGCSNLMSRILPPAISPSSDHTWTVALSEWQKDHDSPSPPPGSLHLQKAWDFVVVSHTFDSLLDASPDDTNLARLLASAARESGAWLSALPMSSIGLRMEDDVIRVSVGIRLGVPLCEPHDCSSCGGHVDRLGIHGLKCRFSKGRHSRHAVINDIIKRSLDSIKVPSHLQPAGMIWSDGKCPDQSTLVPWK